MIVDINDFNRLLEEYGQELRALEITRDRVLLSNGIELTTESEVRKCKRRVMLGSPVWKETFDNVYNIDNEIRASAERHAKSINSRIGGLSTWATYGEAMKTRLNTGVPWNKGLKGDPRSVHIPTAETRRKISEKNSGKNNGMYGRRMTNDERLKHSKRMKELILSGEFTPSTNNRNTHWESHYRGKKYRSSWEALYQYFDDIAEYESLRLRYLYDGVEYVYIIDFVNHQTRELIEIKPAEMLSDMKTQEKLQAAAKWCSDHGYNLVIANKQYFLDRGFPTDLSEFDDKTKTKIRKLYEVKN